MSACIKFQGRTSAAIAASVEQAVHAGAGARRAAADGAAPCRGARVSPATVAAAYGCCASRPGLSRLVGRRGTRVRAHVRPSRRPCDGGRAATARLIDLATGKPDPALLPSLDAALRALPRRRCGYRRAAELRPLASFARASSPPTASRRPGDRRQRRARRHRAGAARTAAARRPRRRSRTRRSRRCSISCARAAGCRADPRRCRRRGPGAGVGRRGADGGSAPSS